MVWLEIKKNIESFLFFIAVFLLYCAFLMGDSGAVLPGDKTTTVIGAIWNKCHGNWMTGSESSCFVRMYSMWTDNAYLPILMPLLCGLPSVINYFEEVETGNKKWILSRSSMRAYYWSKIMGNLVSAMMVALVSVALYYITLFFFFDHTSVQDEAFVSIYFFLSGIMVEHVNEISLVIILGSLCKGVLYFLIYGVVGASFCFWMAIWCRDRYVTYGITIFLCYLRSRIVEELVRKYILEGVTKAGIMADILNPVFLHSAGNSGFYQKKEWLAVIVSFLLIVLHYFMVIWLSRRQFDSSSG